MNSSLLVIVMAVTTFAACAGMSQEVLKAQDARRLYQSMEGVGSEAISVAFSPCGDVTLTGTFEISSKGNGALTLGGREVRVFDAHHDGVTFDGDLLTINAADFDGDGCKDMVITGTALIEDEQTESVVSREPIRAVLVFDRPSGQLRERVTSPHVPVAAAQQAVQGDGPASGGSAP